MTNFRLVPYMLNNQLTREEDELCKHALDLMEQESSADRLMDNYSKWLRLERMEIFTFIFDSNNNPVQASGCQIMSDNVVRVCSRYYIYNKFRKQSSNLLDKLDNFADLQYCIPRLSHYPLIIWSRDKSPGFFRRLKNGRPDIFSSWQLYSKKIEINWKDNFQYVFYTGDDNYMSEIFYEEDW